MHIVVAGEALVMHTAVLGKAFVMQIVVLGEALGMHIVVLGEEPLMNMVMTGGASMLMREYQGWTCALNLMGIKAGHLVGELARKETALRKHINKLQIICASIDEISETCRAKNKYFSPDSN